MSLLTAPTRPLLYLPLGCALLACAPTEPSGPVAWEPAGFFEVEQELLSDQAIERAWPLPEHQLLLDGAAGAELWAPLAEGPLGLPAETLLHDALPLPGGAGLLLATDDGLAIWDELGLTPSPLQDLLGADRALRLAPGPTADSLWLAGDGWLRRWDDGALTRIELPFPCDPELLAAGGRLEDAPVLWLADGADIFGLVEIDGAFYERRFLSESPVRELALDARGALWARTERGLLRHQPDGGWEEFLAPGPVHALTASADRSEVWLSGTDALWRFTGEQLTQLRPVSLTWTAEHELLGVDALGRLLVQAPSGLLRLAEGRPVGFLGLNEGATLDAPGEVTVLPARPELAPTLSAWLDDAPLALEPLPDGGGVSLALDPLELVDGAHELRVEALYPDEGLGQGSLFFTVGVFSPPSWEEDIEPLYEQSCARCHGLDGGARVLDSPAAWRGEFDLILSQVEEQQMPLDPVPPLTEAELRLLIEWRAGGFVE